MLRGEPLVGGLELAFAPGLHPRGPEHLARLLDPRWHLVVTNVPATLARAAQDPAYGLASDDAEGREAALADVRALREEVARLDRPVLAVELHSAPGRARAVSSAEAFAHSLEQIARWPWGRTRLVVEHADAFRPGQEPQKGYLPLAEEVRAVARATGSTGVPIRHTVNWGRSAIETRSADGPEEHVAELAGAGQLTGLMFSGAASAPSARGAAWQDVHLPLDVDEPTSLLTRDRMERTLALAGDVLYLGVKVGSAPHEEGLARFDASRSALRVLDGLVAASAG